MLGYIWRMLIGRFSQCLHQWETVEVREVANWDSKGIITEKYQRYILRCTKCGEITKRDMD